MGKGDTSPTKSARTDKMVHIVRSPSFRRLAWVDCSNHKTERDEPILKVGFSSEFVPRLQAGYRPLSGTVQGAKSARVLRCSGAQVRVRRCSSAQVLECAGCSGAQVLECAGARVRRCSGAQVLGRAGCSSAPGHPHPSTCALEHPGYPSPGTITTVPAFVSGLPALASGPKSSYHFGLPSSSR